MDYSLSTDDDNEVNDDAVAAVAALDDPSDNTYKTLRRYSERLNANADMNSPQRAKKIISVYRSLKKRRTV